MMFSAVPKEYVGTVWSYVKGYLQSAIDTYPLPARIEHVLDELFKGTSGLWIVMDDDEIVAAMTTKIIPYPAIRVLAIPLVGGQPGKMKEWLDIALPVLVQYGKDCDCHQMEGYGREVWGRILAKRGFKKAFSVFEKDLTDGR